MATPEHATPSKTKLPAQPVDGALVIKDDENIEVENESGLTSGEPKAIEAEPVLRSEEYAPLVDCDQVGCVKVYNLEQGISQGRLGGRKNPLNSCVLILVALAKFVIEERIRSFGSDELKESVRNILVNAIVIGNTAYEKFVMANPKRTNTMFTVAEGLSVMSNPFKESKFLKIVEKPGGLSEGIYDVIRKFASDWEKVKTKSDANKEQKHDSQLLLATILGHKAFLITVIGDCIALLDGHSGKSYGGLIAVAPFEDGLKDFCQFVERTYPEAKSGAMSILMHTSHPKFADFLHSL